MCKRLFLAVSLFLFFVASADADQLPDQVRQWRHTNEQQIVDQFAELLSIPNVAADKPNIRRNVDYISKMLTQVGMHVELLELEGSNPVVFAERTSAVLPRP